MRIFSLVVLAGGSLLAFVASAGEFMGRAESTTQGHYIVILKRSPGTSLQDLSADIFNRISKEKGYITAVWTSAINGFSVSGISESAAKEIASHEEVILVEQDFTIQSDAVQLNAPYALDLVDQRTKIQNGSYVYNYTGNNVHVYVIDSGVRGSHSEFGGRVLEQIDFTNIPQGGDLEAAAGHGTGVASVVGGATYGVAKQVRIHSLRVITATDVPNLGSRAISALDWLSANAVHPAVANMSFTTPASPSLDGVLTNVVDGGIFVSVAAGNKPGWGPSTLDSLSDACAVSPARAPAAFTVAAPAGYSYRGLCVDMFAPSDTTVASRIGDSSVMVGYGTSFSAPHVAGVAALILQQFPTITPEQVKWEIIARSTRGLVSTFLNGSSFSSLYSSPDKWVYSLPLGYTTPPTTPSALTFDRCSTYTLVSISAGQVGPSNTPTYFEIQSSSDQSFSIVKHSYSDAAGSGSIRIPAYPNAYVRGRSCNSIGCSGFKAGVGGLCGGGP